MSDMVERVVEAISEARTGNSLSWRHYVAEAKAAIAAMQADAAPVAWMYTHEDGSRFFSSIRQNQPFHDMEPRRRNGWTETPLYAHPPVDNRVSTSSPVDDRAAPETIVKLRDAVEVWQMASDAATLGSVKYKPTANQAAAAIIEADREAVRAEQAAEVADYLKEGETIAECIARNRADANVLLEMFAAERVKVENYAKTMKIISDIANREAAELAKYKALAEKLAFRLEAGTRFMPSSMTVWHREADAALREYKEASDA